MTELEKEAGDYANHNDWFEFSANVDKIGNAIRIKIKRAYLAGAEPREKRIAELEARCNELFLQTCEQAEKIKELEEKLLSSEEYGKEGLQAYLKLEKENKELKAQVEKMKCCGNCENGELSAHEEPCRHCQRCFASKDVTDQENVKDNWEAIKEIKEK